MRKALLHPTDHFGDGAPEGLVVDALARDGRVELDHRVADDELGEGAGVDLAKDVAVRGWGGGGDEDEVGRGGRAEVVQLVG